MKNAELELGDKKKKHVYINPSTVRVYLKARCGVQPFSVILTCLRNILMLSVDDTYIYRYDIHTFSER